MTDETQQETIGLMLVELAQYDLRLEEVEKMYQEIKLRRLTLQVQREAIDTRIREIAIEHTETTGDPRPHPKVTVRFVPVIEFPEDTYNKVVEHGAGELLKIPKERQREVIEILLSQSKGELLELDEVRLRKCYKNFNWIKFSKAVKLTPEIRDIAGAFNTDANPSPVDDSEDDDLYK